MPAPAGSRPDRKPGRTLKTYILQTELWLPRPRAAVFSFFAEARNLELITPPWLKFEVLTPSPILMQAGTLIDYRIRVHRVPIRWRTEITEWQPPVRFVDSQLHGPYALWHHTHTFEEHDRGTVCGDVVRYCPRGGALIHWLFVRRDVERIFRFRQQRLRQIFGATERSACALGTSNPSGADSGSGAGRPGPAPLPPDQP